MNQKSLQRSLYAEGMRLTAGDLNNQRDYDDAKRRLLNLTLWGCGTLWGLAVQAAHGGGLRVEPGLAVDADGRELLLTRERVLSGDQLFAKDAPTAGDWWLCLRYCERVCGEAEVLLPDGASILRPNRVEEDVAFLALQTPGPQEIRLAWIRVEAGGVITRVEPLMTETAESAPAPREATGRLQLSACWGEPGRSLPVAHGLGPGVVWVELALEEEGRLLTGQVGLLRPGLALAAEVDTKSGTFIAAAHPPNDWLGATLTVRWRATLGAGRESSPALEPPPAPQQPLRLAPDFTVLPPGGKVKMTLLDKRGRPLEGPVEYRAEGGAIDGAGQFIAPECEELYTIQARPRGAAEWVTALVLVREGR